MSEWTPADEARARELLAAANAPQACTHGSVPDVCDDCYREREFNLRCRGGLLGRALAEIERLRREPNDWALDAQHAEVERDQLAAEIERLRLVVDVLATKHPDDVAAAQGIAASAIEAER